MSKIRYLSKIRHAEKLININCNFKSLMRVCVCVMYIVLCIMFECSGCVSMCVRGALDVISEKLTLIPC